MRLIIDVPDDHVEVAFALFLAERDDYARRFDRPGWGWHMRRDGQTFWVTGIKGGISIRQRAPPKDGTTDASPRSGMNPNTPTT